MNARLIWAGVLSVIGAGIMALILGLSLYTVIFMPALIVVIIFNIWGDQKSKAVWLGFLAFLILNICLTMIANASVPDSSFMVIAVFLLSHVVSAFVLVFGIFFSRHAISQTPGKQLSIITSVFLIITVFVFVAEKVQFIEHYYRISEELRRYSQLNWPIIVLGTSSRVVITICISILLFLREKVTFYIVAPIFLVLNLIFALDLIFHFTNGHLSHIEIMRYLTMPFRTVIEFDSFVYVGYIVYVFLAVAMVIYFMVKYTEGEGPEKIMQKER